MPIRRLQDCYKPPKKFGWRSDVITHDSAKYSPEESHTPNCISPEYKSSKMGPTPDHDIKPTKPEPTSVLEAFKPSIHGPYEEVPLDFSVKPKNRCSPKTNEFDDEPVKQPNHTTPSVAFPGMVNGNHRDIPSPYNNPVHPKIHAKLIDRNSPEMNWSQSSSESPPPTNKRQPVRQMFGLSPEYPGSCSDDSPDRHKSLLQELLTTQQHRRPDAESSILSSPPFSHANGFSGIPLFNGSSPVVMPTVAPYPFYKFMPQASQALALGFQNPRAQLMSNYVPRFSESDYAECLKGRKQKKKKLDFLADSLKSSSLDDLQNNLRPIGIANPHMSAIHPIPELISPRLQSSNQVSTLSSNRRSPEPATSAISHNATNGSSHGATNSASPPTTAGANGNHGAITDNRFAVNGTDDTSQASSGNDCGSSAMAESDKRNGYSDGRKRKSIPDSEKNEAYYARRSKNNEAARKSRENRRRKEEMIQQAYSHLLSDFKTVQHNYELAMCTLEQTQRQNFTLGTENENLKIQNTLLMEKLNQKKCGQCGTTLPCVN